MSSRLALLTFHGHTFDTVTHETNEMSEMNRQGTAGGGAYALRISQDFGHVHGYGHFVDPQVGVRGNDGPAGKVHPFSRQIASEAACVVTALD